MSANSRFKPLTNERGQGLVEYLIIVALMGVATIAIVRTMNSVVKYRFYAVTEALQGKSVSSSPTQISESTYKKSDLGDFMKNAGEGKSPRHQSSGEEN